MSDRLRGAGKLSRYVTSHPGQLSLAIPLWVGAMSTSIKLGIKVTVGLASNWPCVTDSSGIYPPTGSTAYEREMMSTRPTLLQSMPSFTFLLIEIAFSYVFLSACH